MNLRRALHVRPFMGSSLNCGSIRSSENDDYILRKMYEALNRVRSRAVGHYSLSLNFTYGGDDETDPRALIEDRMESIYYRNFYDWNAKLDRIDDWSYQLKTLGHRVTISTRYRGKTKDRSLEREDARVLMTVAIS